MKLPASTGFLVLLVSLSASLQAAPVMNAPAGRVIIDSPDPRLNPIRRVNPNSRQGSVPATPPVRGPSTQPNPPAPTLENRGVGNSAIMPRQQTTPNLEPTRPPRESTRAP